MTPPPAWPRTSGGIWSMSPSWRGPGVAYRVEKFLRRHRVQMAAILAIVVVAVAGSIMLSMWNRDRVQLAEAEGFKHRNILSQAREQYAKAEREAALATINPIRESKHVGLEARLLQATILVDNRQPEEAMAVLGNLLDEKPEIAGVASLLARQCQREPCVQIGSILNI